MSSFTENLTVTKQKHGWKVWRKFTYYVKEKGGEEITVPLGFETDFASVPRLFWIIIPPDGIYTQAAVLHDYLYSKAGKLINKNYTRRESDGIFLQAMQILGVSWWRRVTMHRAVRGFGWKPWNRVCSAALQKQKGNKDS